MANINAILAKDFDVSQVNFEPMTKNRLGGKMVRLSYGPNKQPIRIQTPEMYIPFDPVHHEDSQPSVNADDGKKPVNFTIEVAMNGYDDPSSKVKAFYDKMVQLDELIVNSCVENSQEWLGDKKKKDVVNEFHRKLVRQKNEKYSPLMKVKVTPIRLDGTLPKVFDISNAKKEELDLAVFGKGVRAKYIIAIQSIWFVNKTFGITAKLVQAAVTHRPSSNVNDFQFLDDDDLVPGSPSAAAPSASAPGAAPEVPVKTGTILDDADLDI